MKFKLYKEFGALNSPPIFESLSQGIKSLGHTVVDQNDDIGVIWSVLWNGRMSGNKNVYYKYLKENKPIIIIEVGNLLRNRTWRLSLFNVNALGKFGNDQNLDEHRSKKLGISLDPILSNRYDHILIACQHEKSLQWHGNPSTEQWLMNTIEQLRKFTDRKIVIRPHPRAKFDTTKLMEIKGCIIQNPVKLPTSYDDFDIDYNCHVVINHNSGPSIQSIIKGVPVICHDSSLAHEMSSKIDNIENCSIPDRTEWFTKLCHTEWTVDELKTGEPLKRLLQII